MKAMRPTTAAEEEFLFQLALEMSRVEAEEMHEREAKASASRSSSYSTLWPPPSTSDAEEDTFSSYSLDHSGQYSPALDDDLIQLRYCSSTSSLSEEAESELAVSPHVQEDVDEGVQTLSTQTSIDVTQTDAIDELVARQLLRALCKSKGICNFVPQAWQSFYRREARSSGSKAERQAHTPETKVVAPKLADFLTRFPHIFSFDEKTDSRCTEIRANIRLGTCKKYIQTDSICNSIDCRKLHCCGYYLTGSCKHGESCRVSHDLTTEHNAKLLRRHLVDDLPVNDLAVLLAARVPQLCYQYNSPIGCVVAEKCRKMHVCQQYIEQECTSHDCVRCHDLLAYQPRAILDKYGFNLNLKVGEILRKLRVQLASVRARQPQKTRDEQTRAQQGQLIRVGSDNSMATNQGALGVCYSYNSGGCVNANCTRLHMCNRFVRVGCHYGANCRSNHDLTEDQPKFILMKFGFDVVKDGVDSVLGKLREQLTDRGSSLAANKDGHGADNFASTLDTCINYNRSSKNGCRLGERCMKLHICRHYILDQCKYPQCQRSHDLTSEHARMILKSGGIDVVALGTARVRDNLKAMLQNSFAVKVTQPNDTSGNNCGKGNASQKQQQNHILDRNRPLCSTVPNICILFNKKGGCPVKSCQNLHLCRQFIMGECTNKPCHRSHNCMSDQPKQLLVRNGFDIVALSESEIIGMLREQLNAVHKQHFENQMSAPQRDDPRVCAFHLLGRCIYKNNDCFSYHSQNKLPYQWQWCSFVEEDDNKKQWTDFCPTANTELESRFCDAAEDRWNVKDEVMGSEVMINFETMTFGGQSITGLVRRLGTESVVSGAKRNRYSTVWTWFSQTEEGLWQAFPIGNKSNDGPPLDLGNSNAIPSSVEIETKYLTNPNARIPYRTSAGVDEKQFLIDLKKMTLIDQLRQTIRKVRRRPELYRAPDKKSAKDSTVNELKDQDVTVRYPVYWNIDAMKDDTVDYKLIPIEKTGQTAEEYGKVAMLFAATMPGIPLKTIQRIQNRDLWESFDAFKTRMNKKRSPPAEAMLLFHGTKQQYVEAICQQGFDWRMCGASVGTVWGKGSYFARDATYSKSYTDCKTMFVVQVLVGDYALGNSTYVRPPPKDPNKPYQDLYDSVVNDIHNPLIYVTFEKNQSYPEYLIEY